MPNEPAEHGNGPLGAGTPQDSPSGGMDWHRRAGPVFKYGLAAGFALILLGGLSLGLSLTNAVLEILVVCAGLSIILGAFGSTASVTIPGQSMLLVGVAAVAVALFTILMGAMDDRYVRVKIAGDVEESQIDFVGDRNYLGAFQESERTFDFIIFGKEIKRPVLALYIALPTGAERPFACIARSKLAPYLASGKTIEWSFDSKNDTLINIEDGQRIAELGPCREASNPTADQSSLKTAAKTAKTGTDHVFCSASYPSMNRRGNRISTE